MLLLTPQDFGRNGYLKKFKTTLHLFFQNNTNTIDYIHGGDNFFPTFKKTVDVVFIGLINSFIKF